MLSNQSLSRRSQQLADKSLFISCIVPVFNEEQGISAFLDALTAFLQKVTTQFEIIVIDDGSHDATVQTVLAHPNSNVKLIGFSRNFGKEIALTSGLEHCAGDVAILLDADFQHPIETIPVFLAHWSEGFNMVYGVRQNRDTESRLKRNSSRFFYWLMAKMSSVEIPNNAGDFRLLDRAVIDALNNFKERTRFMKGLYAWVGFKKKAVCYNVQNRKTGQSSWGLLKLTELALTAITSFSSIPLRAWSFIGFVLSLLSIIYAAYIVTITLLYGADLPGFPTLAAAIMFFGGVQLLSIGILGEYIARIFTEVKQRPKYLIELKHGFSEDK